MLLISSVACREVLLIMSVKLHKQLLQTMNIYVMYVFCMYICTLFCPLEKLLQQKSMNQQKIFLWMKVFEYQENASLVTTVAYIAQGVAYIQVDTHILLTTGDV